MLNRASVRKASRSPWSYLAVIILALLVAFLIYQANPHTSTSHASLREDLEDTVRLVTIISFFFALINWMGSQKDKRRNLSLDEAEKFLEQYSKYRMLVDAEGIQDFSQYCKDCQTSGVRNNILKLKLATNNVLRISEKLSLGVEYGMLDDEILQMLLVKIFQEIYKINANYIDEEQIINPGRWIHFKHTAFRWHQELPRIDRESHRMMGITERMKARMQL
jgi:hypothetical protein